MDNELIIQLLLLFVGIIDLKRELKWIKNRLNFQTNKLKPKKKEEKLI